jgi:hypothetical protein
MIAYLFCISGVFNLKLIKDNFFRSLLSAVIGTQLNG